MKVFVYWNLHKKVWSVKALQGLQKGRVVAHRNDVMIENAERSEEHTSELQSH